jgi:hypothetical protein
MSNTPVEFDCVEVLNETDAAWWLNIEGEKVCIPKSQLLDGTDALTEGDEVTIVIPEWLALEKGII